MPAAAAGEGGNSRWLRVALKSMTQKVLLPLATGRVRDDDGVAVDG